MTERIASSMTHAPHEPIRRAAEALANKAGIAGNDGWIDCVPTVGLMLAALGAPTGGMVAAGARAMKGVRTTKQNLGMAPAGQEAVVAVWAAMVDQLVGHALELHGLGSEEWNVVP